MINETSTLDDVAKLSGVCKSTASRILAAENGKDIPFAASTQEKVRQAAKMLGYRPSKLARGLITSRTNVVGLVIPSVKDSFFPSVTSAVEERLAENGYNVILSNTNSDSTVERVKIEDLLSWRVDGLVIAPSQENGDAGLFWELYRMKIPFVLIDRDFLNTPFCSVTTDDYNGAKMAVEHLISIGRKRIARIGYSKLISTNQLRHSGYMDALIEHAMLPSPDLIIETTPNESGGRAAFEKLMALKNPPDAIFCFSDPVAIGVMEACIEKGMAIPDDIALMGYADLDNSSVLRVPLSTIRQPREQLGWYAADMLLSQMQGKQLEQTKMKLPVELVIRDSTEPRC